MCALASAATVLGASIFEAASIGFATVEGGTSGGGPGARVVRVSTVAELTAAVGEKNTEPTIAVLTELISGSGMVRLGSNKTIVGAAPGAGLTGVGLMAHRQRNIVVRNIAVSKVAHGDGFTMERTHHVWVDHCEFFSERTGPGRDKNYYDGLIDVTHGSDFVTISNTFLHDHWKASLVGHSDRNAAEDTGRLRITYANNHWRDVGSRTPSLRFGTGHVLNSLFERASTGINARMGAQVLVENNVFHDVRRPIESVSSSTQGFITAVGNDFGGVAVTAPASNISGIDLPYNYTLVPTDSVAASLEGVVGTTLTWDDLPEA